VTEDTWHLAIPPQRQSAGSVVVETEPPPDYPASEVLLELHSHHTMTAYFSRTDDADEQGFRLYAVLGTIDQQPSVRLRVGVYGSFWELPITTVFEPLPGVVDARDRTTRRPLPIRAIRPVAPTQHPLPALVQRWMESEWVQRLSALVSGVRKDPS
jgi:hypothetical protein